MPHVYSHLQSNIWLFSRRLTVLGIFLLTGVLSSAQTTLTFEGLKRTQLSYLSINLENVELSSHTDTLLWNIESSVFDSVSLLAFRQNLVNLPPIQGASHTVHKMTVDGKVNYHVHWEMVEARTLSPLFGFGGVKGNVHFLIGINDQHLFGKGQELMAFYQNIQGEHNFLLAFKNPSINNSRYGISAEVRRYAAEEPVYFNSGPANYLYINQNVSLGSSYRLQPRHNLNVGATFFREEFSLLDEPDESLGAPVFLSVNKLLLKVGHQIDRRNYLSERVSGSFNSTISQVVLNTNQEPFLIAWHEFLRFGLIGRRGNWASRLRLGLATNRDSPFAPFVLDSQLNIRGSGNRVDRGSAQAVLNLEYRHLVWKDRRGNFSAQAVGFSDLGTWRSPGGPLIELTNGSTFRQFVGGGLRIISAKAKNAVLRLDYGLDVTNAEQRGFVLGFGQYF